MSDATDPLEHHEHAEHAAESGRRYSALLIAVLAAGLAFAEQGAQHAQAEMSEKAIAAADLWAQYQAKSIRANEARDLAAVLAVTSPASPARDAVIAQLHGDATRFENDGSTGKTAIANQARALEAARDASHARLQSFDYAAAAFQLGIVLTTASVITRSRMLVAGAAVLGVAGAVLGLLGLIRPDWAGW
jgi:hypothetical protein